jgi:hypothetical protein
VVFDPAKEVVCVEAVFNRGLQHVPAQDHSQAADPAYRKVAVVALLKGVQHSAVSECELRGTDLSSGLEVPEVQASAAKKPPRYIEVEGAHSPVRECPGAAGLGPSGLVQREELLQMCWQLSF